MQKLQGSGWKILTAAGEQNAELFRMGWEQ